MHIAVSFAIGCAYTFCHCVFREYKAECSISSRHALLTYTISVFCIRLSRASLSPLSLFKASTSESELFVGFGQGPPVTSYSVVSVLEYSGLLLWASSFSSQIVMVKFVNTTLPSRFRCCWTSED